MLAVLENADEIVKMLLKMESLQKNFVNSYQKGALCCAVEMNNKRMVQLLTDNGVMATPGTLYRVDIYGDDYITGRVLQTRDADFYTPQQQHTLIYSAVVKGKYTYNISKAKSETSVKRQRFPNRHGFFLAIL